MGNKKKIVVMLTWRNYLRILKSSDEINEAGYFKALNEIIRDEEFISEINSYGCNSKFFFIL